MRSVSIKTAITFPIRASVWFLIASLVVLAIFISQLHLWPQLSQDEVQIVDLGRVMLEPDTDWALSWLVHDSIPFFGSSYLGNVLQEVSYRLFAPEDIGPRLSSVIGALVSSGVTLGWLRSRGIQKNVALVLALAMLLEPIFNESYRQGRVDSWAFSICIGACWLLSSVSEQAGKGAYARSRIFFAGILAGVAPFFWPTTLALFPLIAYEFMTTYRSGWKSHQTVKSSGLYRFLWLFLGGGLLAAIVLSIPLVLEFESQWIGILSSFQIQRVASVIQQPIISIFVLHDPLFLPVMLLSLVLCGRPGLVIALAASVLLMYQTMLYPMRVIYVLPYAMAIIGAGFAVSAEKTILRLLKIFLGVALAAWVSSSAWTSLVARPVIAYIQAEARSPSQLEDNLRATIGDGPLKVLTTEWEVYYAARRLGWKIYSPIGRLKKGSDDFSQFLNDLDFAVIRDKFAFSKSVNIDDLNRNGYCLISKISFVQPEATRVEWGGVSIDGPEKIYDDLLVFSNSERLCSKRTGNQTAQ